MIFMKMKKLLGAMAAAVMAVSALPASQICGYNLAAYCVPMAGTVNFDSMESLSEYLHANGGIVELSSFDYANGGPQYMEDIESLWLPSGFSAYTEKITNICFSSDNVSVTLIDGNAEYCLYSFTDSGEGKSRYSQAKKDGESKKVNGRTVFRINTEYGTVYCWKQGGIYFLLTANGEYDSYYRCSAEEYVIPEYTDHGLKNIGGSLYYVQPDGSWYVGWKTIGNKKYFFGMDGAAAVKNTTIGNVRYTFDPDGSCTGKYTGWLVKEGFRYYCKNGRYVTGVNEISGKTYTFNDNGILMY